VDAANTVEVLQHVTILDVVVAEGTIQVDLYGGDASACGTVTYHFDDPDELTDHARTLRAWQTSGSDVTYVKRGEIVVLMDELAYLDELYSK
jgi:hypothetical protein